MNKKISLAIFGMFFISLVVGASFGISEVVYPKATNEVAPPTDTLTFDCDGKEMQVNLTEPNNKIDKIDIDIATKRKCSGDRSSIENSGSETWKQSDKYPEIQSFNSTEITERELAKDITLCADEGKEYDLKTDSCLEVLG